MLRRITIVIVLCFVAYIAGMLRLRMYGKAYNQIRLQHGIPTVRDIWREDYNLLEGRILYSYKNKPPRRCHLSKTVEVDYFSGIKRESDYYLIEDLKVSIDAIFTYSGKQPWYIRYYGSDGQMQVLTRKQLSDTLQYYKVAE